MTTSGSASAACAYFESIEAEYRDPRSGLSVEHAARTSQYFRPFLESRIKREHFEERYSLMGQVLPPRADVVELGSGLGGPGLFLALRGHSVVGLDPICSDVAVARARADLRRASFDRCGGSATFFAGTAVATPLRDESADAVVFFESLGHIHPLEAGLAAAWRVLRPGGVLFISESDRRSPLVCLQIMRRNGGRMMEVRREDSLVWMYKRVHSVSEWSDILIRHGFDPQGLWRGGFNMTLAGNVRARTRHATERRPHVPMSVSIVAQRV